MGLEKQLAEIEVMAEEVMRRANGKVPLGKVDDEVYWSTISGLRNDPSLIYRNYQDSKRAIGKLDNIESSRLLTEFCLNTKNLADSLNIFLQIMYGNQEPALKKLETNTPQVPKTKDGKSLVDIHLANHDCSKSSILNVLRNMKAHGRGYSALTRLNETRTGFAIKVEEPGNPVKYVDAGQWLDAQMKNYFDMTHQILSEISAFESQTPYGRKSKVKRESVLLRRLSNWKKRHQAPVLIGLAASLVGAGIVGTLAYQKITEKDRSIYEGNEIKALVSQASSTRRADLVYAIAAMEVEKNRFIQTLNDISNRTQNVGVTLESYVGSLKALSAGVIDPKLKEDYESFISHRESFRNNLGRAYQYVGSDAEAIDKIQKISDLLVVERMLGEDENKIMKVLDWRRPYDYSTKSNK